MQEAFLYRPVVSRRVCGGTLKLSLTVADERHRAREDKWMTTYATISAGVFATDLEYLVRNLTLPNVDSNTCGAQLERRFCRFESSDRETLVPCCFEAAISIFSVTEIFPRAQDATDPLLMSPLQGRTYEHYRTPRRDCKHVCAPVFGGVEEAPIRHHGRS